jgi:hypothetical protein
MTDWMLEYLNKDIGLFKRGIELANEFEPIVKGKKYFKKMLKRLEKPKEQLYGSDDP